MAEAATTPGIAKDEDVKRSISVCQIVFFFALVVVQAITNAIDTEIVAAPKARARLFLTAGQNLGSSNATR